MADLPKPPANKIMGRPVGAVDSVTRMTIRARTELINYLRTGEEYCSATGTWIPDAFKARLDELIAASKRGNIKATRDIIDRIAGRPTQSLDVNVSDRKMIVDTRTLPPGDAPHHITGQDVKVYDLISDKSTPKPTQ